MSKPTEGPWVAEPHGDPQWAVRVDDENGFHFICVTTQGNDEANARLIASSPWLLLLVRCLVQGWSLDKSMLYDEECVDGYKLSTPSGYREWSWVGDVTDVDERTFREVQTALGN